MESAVACGMKVEELLALLSASTQHNAEDSPLSIRPFESYFGDR
jgi:hypothetical protein